MTRSHIAVIILLALLPIITNIILLQLLPLEKNILTYLVAFSIFLALAALSVLKGQKAPALGLTYGLIITVIIHLLFMAVKLYNSF